MPRPHPQVLTWLPLALLLGCGGSAGGLTPDAALEDDAGTSADAGSDAGAMVEPDAGSTADAGSALDAGSSTDAGNSTDAGSATDAGPHPDFFGDSRCADAGFRLCEDFEAATLDTSLWTIVGGAANVRIDTALAARGHSALHVTRVGNGAAYVRETRSFPATNNTYYGRMFVRFVSLPSRPMTYAHWTFAAASGTGIAGEIRLSGQLPTNTNRPQLFGVGTDNRTQDAGTGDWTLSDADPAGSPREVPLDEWLCIEWLHDGAHNETRFWWDEVEHPSLHTTQSIHGGNSNPFVLPRFTQLWVGWQEYQTSTQTYELWVDALALDDARIGCLR